MTTKLCLTLTGPTPQEATKQIRMHLGRIDLIELRLDLWNNYSFEGLHTLQREFSIPVIYTLRPKHQGGAYKEDEATRYQNLQQLLNLKPDYLDVEYDLPNEWLEQLHQQAEGTTHFIHSYHHMIGMPDNLDALYETLNKRRKQGDLLKIACTPQNSTQALQLLEWAKMNPHKAPHTLLIGMGEYGAITRICVPCIHMPWSFVHADNQPPAAPGQLSCTTLCSLYRFHSLHPSTPLYGLLGDPVTGSISHWSHNLFFELFDIPALYLKCKTTAHELPALLRLARCLNFKGFSITHPFKERIIPYLDAMDSHAKQIGAVNTLRLEGDKWVGYNTDGAGTLTALQATGPLKKKRVIVLGSGGCAKAIAHTLKAQECDIIIMSRNLQTGQDLAKSVQGKWLFWNLATLPNQRAHLLIQATSSSIDIKPQDLVSIERVMETITLPKESTLTQAAFQQGCCIVYGYSMFEAQALQQMRLWFSHIPFSCQDPRLSYWRLLIASAVSEGKIPDFLPSTKETCYY